MTEQLSLLALPPGRYPQPDGSIWEVGQFQLSGTKSWSLQTFSAPFPATPRLFLTPQSANDSDTVIARAKRLDEDSFKAALFEQESYQNGHPTETVGYLAVYSPTTSGQVTLGGVALDYTLGGASVDHNWQTVGAQQLVFAEEQSADPELTHADEAVNTLYLGGHFFAQDVEIGGGDPGALRRSGPTPSVAYQDGGAGAAGGLFYAHTDHLGAIAKVTDENGVVAWDADRWPFGRTDIRVESIELPLRFPGQYYDQESGLYYNYFRDYDPSTGRYIQSDPIGLAGGLNTYSYVKGNPLKYIDPDGLFGRTAVGAIAPPTGGGSGNGNIDWSAPFWPSWMQRMVDGSSDADGVNGLSPADEYAANAAEVHRWCDEPKPPYFLSECDRWKWKYKKAKRCLAAREEHTRRWFGGKAGRSHQRVMNAWRRNMEKARLNMELYCGKNNCDY